MPAPPVELVPLVYLFASFFALFLYIRKKYTVPDPSRCDGCRLRSFCLRIGIPPFLLPRRFANPVPRRKFLGLAATIYAGYILLLSALALFSHFNEGHFGAYLSASLIWLPLLLSLGDTFHPQNGRSSEKPA